MRRGTTPTYTMTFKQVGTGAQVQEIIVTFKQAFGEYLELAYTRGEIAINGDIASFTLTQAQTLAFKKGKLSRQMKVKFLDDNVQDTDIVVEEVVDDQHGKVI